MRFYCPCVFIFHRKSGLQIVLAVRRTGDADYSDWAEQGGFMKLQTRIMVGFFMIILVPLLLFAATLHGMREAQIRGPKKAETAETASSEYDYDYGITIADSETSQDGIQIMTKDLFVSALVILVFTSLSVGLWIYRSIATPLVKLRKATRNIKDGNLDFVLDVEGITAVKGYVEGIMDGVADTPEKMDRYVRTIYNKTNEMDHLINELTFYSKIDTNRIPYTFSKLNVEDYFSDCAEEIGLELETRGIQLCYANYVDRSVQVIADGEQIRRVIHNIIGNAIKYMDKAKGVIQIRVKDVGDFVQVEIEDNGKGIASKDLAYIFDRFYRTDVSRNSSKGGSGIGLSIVKKIIEDHGGRIWASSKEGIGTEIHFVLRKYQEVIQE